jgi:magnesium transporter
MKNKDISPDLTRITSVKESDLTWTDISFPSKREVELLEQNYHFHHLSLEDSLGYTQLSKVDDYGTYLFLVLHFPNSFPDEPVIKSNSLVAFIGQDYIITLHEELKPLTGLFHRCEVEEETRKQYFQNGAGNLIYLILKDLIDSCFPILDKLLVRMNDIEEEVFDETKNDTAEISVLRRDIIAMRRIIWPSRSVVIDLIVLIERLLHKNLNVYFESLIDHLNKIWEMLEEAKEIIEVFKDTDFVLVTNRTNRIIQTLTIISSIFLPFLAVSGLYGMNINLPGGIERGSFASFAILLGIMIVVSAGMLYFFRRRHWI